MRVGLLLGITRNHRAMNSYLMAAGVLAFIVGLVHSVLGEILIFRGLRSRGIVPTDGGQLLRERHVRILWASWHVVTVLGWCVATILSWLAQDSSPSQSHVFIARAIAAAMLVSAAFVFVGTKGKHPGWAGLLGVAVLVFLGDRAR
jgi:hypothetical protein